MLAPQMLAPLITLFVLVGTLGILGCNVGIARFFFRPPPRGDAAVGLLLPFVGYVVAAMLVILAGLLAAGRSGDILASVLPISAVVAAVSTVLVTLGVMLAAFVAFGSWAEGVASRSTGSLIAIGPITGNLMGVLGPVVLAGALLIAAWTTPQWWMDNPGSHGSLRVVCWTLTGLAMVGYLIAASIVTALALSRLRRRRLARSQITPEQQAAQRRFRNTPIEQLLREELAALPADASFARIVGYFDPSASPRKLNRACEHMLVERALAVSNLQQQLVACMRQRNYAVRRGAAEFVRATPQEVLVRHHDAFAQALAAGLATTAEAIATRPAWLSETFDSKPDPLGHVQSLLAAAERFKGLPGEKQIIEAGRSLAKSALDLDRDAKWRKLAKLLARSGYPVPLDGISPLQ